MLTLNLLHEEQKQLQARQRDPLKLGLLALAGIAVLFMGYYVYRLVDANSVAGVLRARQAEWNRQQPLAAAAQTQETELNQTIAAAAAVSKRIEGRLYWAPLLETLQRAVPPGVQINNFSGNNELSGERVTLVVDGVAAGPEPRAAAEMFRIGLAEALGKTFPGPSASFRTLEEAKDTALLDGKPTPTAKFSIDLNLKKPAAAVAPEPARPRRR